MATCEDFPCCGHGPGECPIGPDKECPDCGKTFTPDSNASRYCYACGQTPVDYEDEDPRWEDHYDDEDALGERLEDEFNKKFQP